MKSIQVVYRPVVRIPVWYRLVRINPALYRLVIQVA